MICTLGFILGNVFIMVKYICIGNIGLCFVKIMRKIVSKFPYDLLGTTPPFLGSWILTKSGKKLFQSFHMIYLAPLHLFLEVVYFRTESPDKESSSECILFFSY